jgi:hypothetical protein
LQSHHNQHSDLNFSFFQRKNFLKIIDQIKCCQKLNIKISQTYTRKNVDRQTDAQTKRIDEYTWRDRPMDTWTDRQMKD